jgi:hypothetical protein
MWRRIVTVVMGLVGLLGTARAQGVIGIFEQGAYELKEYGQQIAALGLFSTLEEKGYGVKESGLASIGSITGNEYGLHQTYFGSLRAVNPAVGEMAAVVEILALEAGTVKGFGAAMRRWEGSGGLTAGELAMLGQIYANLCTVGANGVLALGDVAANGKLTMSDDQRMERIMQIDRQMREHNVFAQQVSAETDLLVMERQAGVIPRMPPVAPPGLF